MSVGSQDGPTKIANREFCATFALSSGHWHSPGPWLRVNRAPRAHFIASPESRETCQTGWRRGGDLNPRNPSEFTRSPGVRLKPGSATSPRAGPSMPFAPAHLPPATSAACERSAPRGSTVDRTSDAVLPRETRHEFRARALGKHLRLQATLYRTPSRCAAAESARANNNTLGSR
jgi:hypothetical protein